MAVRTFTPETFTSIAPSNPDAYVSLNFDAKKELFGWWVDKSGCVIIDCFDGEPITVPPAISEKFRYPIVQRFGDGRWLIVDARTRSRGENAVIYSSHFEAVEAFHVGDAIEQILIDDQDRIWVGYFDESGGVGLIRYSETGEATYNFNQSSGFNIFDLYAMTTDSRGDVWVYPYTDFFLAKISGADDAEIVLSNSPVSGARAICVGGGFAAFFGSYGSEDVVVHEINSGESRSVTIQAPGEQIVPTRTVACCGEEIAVLSKTSVYRFHLIDLINATDFG